MNCIMPSGRRDSGRTRLLRPVMTAVAIATGVAAGTARAAECVGLPGVSCSGGSRATSSSRSYPLKPVETLGGAFATSNDPATWGAITFHGDGSRCIGLLRRGACK